MVPASRSDLRKFGLTVGGAFLLLGVISWWRGHDSAPDVLWILGALLAVPGLIVPGVLAPIQRGWMAGAAVLGHINTRIILTVAFFAVFTPLGLVMRLVRDPLNRSMKQADGSNWRRRELQAIDPASYERQF